MTLPPSIDASNPINQFYTLNKDDTKENINFIREHLVCTQCGACCRNTNGEVLFPPDVEQLARRLGISKNAFKVKYTITYGGKRLLKGPCPFLVDNRCSVYEDRPIVCKTYPLNRRKIVPGHSFIMIGGCPSGKAFVQQYVQGIKPELEKGGD
jgi:Fe-S-cluster containining protein